MRWRATIRRPLCGVRQLNTTQLRVGNLQSSFRYSMVAADKAYLIRLEK
jgi:hypothetical protein